MRVMKYSDGWTRRHFLEQVGKGVFAAGVINPLMDVIGRNGSLEAAYPPELLSIEAYTKGKLKPGDVLNAENVDIVKDLLDGNCYTLDGKPWIGGNPFPEPKSAQEVLMANSLSWGKHDTIAHPVIDWDTDADGN